MLFIEIWVNDVEQTQMPPHTHTHALNERTTHSKMHRYSKIHTHTQPERYGLRFRFSLVDFVRLSSSFLFFSLLNAFSQKRKHTFPTQQRWQPTPRRGKAWSGPDTHSRATVGWGGDSVKWERVSVSLLTTAVECSMLSCCVCVCMFTCVCAVYGESVKSWWAHRSICHPHIVYLVAAAAESLPQFLPPLLFPITALALFAVCVCLQIS